MVKMGYVWDRTVEFLGDALPVLMPLVALTIFVPGAISGSLAELGRVGAPDVRLALGLLSIAFAVLGVWAQLAIVALAIDPTMGRRATTVATARLLPAVGVFLLLLVALFLLFLPLVLLMVAGGMDMGAMEAGRPAMGTIPGGHAAAIVVYAFAMLAGLPFVAARLAAVTPVIVAERRGAGAIARAFALTRGLTWRLVGVLILYAAVAIVAILAVQTVFGSILRLLTGGGAGPVSVAGVVTAIFVAAVRSGFTVLAAAFCGKLYVAILRARDAARPSMDADAT